MTDFDPKDPFRELGPEEIAAAPMSDAGSAGNTSDFVPTIPQPGIHPWTADYGRFKHKKLGQPTAVWLYSNAADEPVGYLCRFNLTDGAGNPMIDAATGKQKKEFRPFRHGTIPGKNGKPWTTWHWKGWTGDDKPPLYNLAAIVANPDKLVMVCEGEKSVDAAAVLFPDFIVTTPMNGAKAPQKTDWMPLSGRHVIMATDNDDAGRQFGDAVCGLIRAIDAGPECDAARIEELKPDRIGAYQIAADGAIELRSGDCPPKWDLADALAEGWTAEHVKQRQEDPAFFCAYHDAAERERIRLAFGKPRTEETGKSSHESPYRLTERGVEVKLELEDSTEWKWFCSYLKVASETRNANGEAWGRLLVIRDNDFHEKTWAMPMEMLASDGTEYRRVLLSLGLILSANPKARQWLAEYIQTARPDGKARCVNRLGWNGSAFVLPDGAIGQATGEHVIFQTVASGAHAFYQAGTLEEWQEFVALPCIGNSRLVLAVCMAFAAPLLAITGDESGGMHMRGASSGGKSTVMAVAGSVCGGGGLKGYVRQWRATDNSLESVAAMHCDSLLCLDELSQVDAKAAGAVAYMLANGAGKSRAGRGGEAREVAEWRLLFLSNGEISLADKLAEDGRHRRVAAGQEVRVIDLPIDAGAGFGAFETLPGASSANGFADSLKAAASRYYGTALRAYLREVAANIDAIKSVVIGFRSEFTAENVPAGADGQVSRVARRFGLIAAAGELAIQLGILPWQQGEANNAAARCLADWLSNRGGIGAAEKSAAISAVRRFIELHGESRFTPWEGYEGSNTEMHRTTVNRAGFRRKTNSGIEYFVLPEVWKSEVCAGLDATAAAKALAEVRMLKPGSGGKMAVSQQLPGGEGKNRVYHILPAIMGGDDA